MPVTKRGKLRYTSDQLEEAKQVSALDYARSRGYPLVGKDKYYKMEGHDSMVFTEDGWWNWNSRQLNGQALEFCMHYSRLKGGSLERNHCYDIVPLLQKAGRHG